MTTDHQLAEAAAHCAYMLAALGIHGDERTPARHVRALAQLTAGVHEDPIDHLGVQFPAVSADPGLIGVTAVPFASLCAHHALPFAGTFAVAYLPKPGGNIVGLSKLTRLVTGYATRPQVQERLAAQVLTALMAGLPARGAAIAIRATHSCMALRGARTGPTAAMVTVDHAGDLLNDPWRGEFAALARTVLAGVPA